MEDRPVKMTERSIVLDNNQLTIMLETDEDPHNSSVDMLNNFKKMFETKKNSRKREIYSTSSDKPPADWLDWIKSNDTEKLNLSYNLICSQNRTKDSNKLNLSVRNEYTNDYEKLNELFEEFKEQKLGLRNQQYDHDIQEIDSIQDLRNSKTKLSIEEFMKLKQQRYGDKVATAVNRNETNEERERRVFQMIKQRQKVNFLRITFI